MKFSGYSISPCGVNGLCKSATVWVHDEERNSCAPLMYIKRPKWIKDEAAWIKIVESITVTFRRGEEIK